MLTANRLKQALAERRPMFGLLSTVSAPLLVEMIGYAGFDFVVIDQEHTETSPAGLANLLRAAECGGLTPLVRVAAAQPEPILRALDAGAEGVLVPHVSGPEEAARVCQASRYHPDGQRGLAGGRHTGFGTLGLA
ncbi:MAG: HpcH/HpaI aldolase/citrate lyase family protein, partial [Thiohalorhabdaceae bacterium]